jgi:hypothetical protein
MLLAICGLWYAGNAHATGGVTGVMLFVDFGLARLKEMKENGLVVVSACAWSQVRGQHWRVTWLY